MLHEGTQPENEQPEPESNSKTPPANSSTIGELIDRMYALRDERRDIAAKDKELKDEYDQLEQALIARMGEMDTDKASSPLATASIKSETMAGVKDWDAFYRWISTTQSFHMLERRPSNGAFREMHAAGEEVPGVEAFTKVSINLRKR